MGVVAPLIVAALVNWNDTVAMFDTVGRHSSAEPHGVDQPATVSFRLTSAATIKGAIMATPTARFTSQVLIAHSNGRL